MATDPACTMAARLALGAHPRLRAARLERPARAAPTHSEGRRRCSSKGDNRISVVIRYLTQSSWSHAALYIGDELLRRGGAVAESARREFGADAEHLLVEALPRGVVVAPLAKYVDYNVRIVRPHRLRPEHLKQILEEAIGAIGWHYDLRNVLDLAPLPAPGAASCRIASGATRSTSAADSPTEVICSSLLGRLFARVRFPSCRRSSFPTLRAERPAASGLVASHARPRERTLHRPLPHAPPDAADAARTSISRRTSRS